MGEIYCKECGFLNWHVFCHLTGICENCGSEIKECPGCELNKPITILDEILGYDKKTIWNRCGERQILNKNTFETFKMNKGRDCYIKCYKPWIHGCNRENKISPEIDEFIACEYY